MGNMQVKNTKITMGITHNTTQCRVGDITWKATYCLGSKLTLTCYGRYNVHSANKKLVVLTTEWLPWLHSHYERFILVWKPNCVR